MKTITLQIDDDTHDELAELAYVLGCTVEEFLISEGMHWINEGRRKPGAPSFLARFSSAGG